MPRNQLQIRKKQRAARTRAPLRYASVPRLCVHRTNRFIYVQIIDDRQMKTLAAASSLDLPKGKRTKIEEAAAIGQTIGKIAKEKGIEKAVFDRGAYRYHGRIKALAEAARAAGLKF